MFIPKNEKARLIGQSFISDSLLIYYFSKILNNIQVGEKFENTRFRFNRNFRLIRLRDFEISNLSPKISSNESLMLAFFNTVLIFWPELL